MKREWLINLRGLSTQQEIANKIGISQNFYSCIETGERDPSILTAKKVAVALGFDWQKFYTDDKQKGA